MKSKAAASKLLSLIILLTVCIIIATINWVTSSTSFNTRYHDLLKIVTGSSCHQTSPMTLRMLGEGVNIVHF